MHQPEKVVTLAQMAQCLNSDNREGEIIAFRHHVTSETPSIFPLRLDCLIIVLCKGGKGTLGIDLREFEIRRNTLLVIQPQNYIYLSKIEEDWDLDIFACSKKIVEEVLPKFTDVLPIIIYHRTEPSTILSDNDAKQVDDLFRLIKSRIDMPESPFKKQKIICLLQSALFELMDIRQGMKSDGNLSFYKTRREELLAKFILSISENFRKERQVSFYARKLGISPKHLSTIVKEITKRTAGDWIESYVTMEAKMLLQTTDLSIQEISDKLNFPSQSLFGKYFRYRTGMSPTSFRKQSLLPHKQ